jgi:glutathione peroxidase
MQKIILLTTLILNGALANSFYEIGAKSSKGKELNFKDFKNKVVVVTNIATRCGYTPQLDDLEKLNKKFSGKDFVLIGVPSNDFGGQTPESSEKAAEFCRLNYGVSFPILKKQVVSGDSRSELFKYIQKEINKDFDIKWNFEKFIIGKDGKLKGNFRSSTKPLSNEIVSLIEKELK